jgi:hypothetical protein
LRSWIFWFIGFVSNVRSVWLACSRLSK